MIKKLPEKLVEMGRVMAPFGIKGWVKIEPYTESPRSLVGYKTWWLENGGTWQEHVVEQAQMQGMAVAAKLAGFEDRDQAIALKGRSIAIPRADFPRAKANEFYWADLIGLRVKNTQAQELGTVESVIGTGANDVLVVQDGTEKPERLIPFIAEVIRNVDVAGGVIEVEWGVDF